MDKYLNINNSCEIIYGNNGAVLYDFSISTQYDIADIESNILLDTQKGMTINSLYLKYDKDTLNNFISDIEKFNVGYVSNSFNPTEPYRIGNLKIGDLRKSYSLNKAYIELPTSCNKNCSYCNTPQINGCYSCSSAKNVLNKDVDFYFSLIDSLCCYDCNTIIFHGGNPLSDWDFTKSILNYIVSKKTTFPNLFIITNDTDINNTILNYLLKNKINIIINIDYSINFDTKEFLYSYKHLIGLETNTIFNFIVNYDYIDKFKIFYSNLINHYANISYSIYSKEKSFKLKYISDLPNNLIDIDSFNKLDSSHPCLFGTISIKSNKKIYPCIAFNNNELLDLSEYPLETIFFTSNKLFEFWNISLNNLESCSKCKFRKSCSDCRAFELSVNNNIISKSTCSLI